MSFVHYDSRAIPIMRQRGVSYSEAQLILRNEGKSQTRRPSLAVPRGAAAQPRPDQGTAPSICGKSGNPTPSNGTARNADCAAAASVDPYAPRQVLAPNPEAEALAKQIVTLAKSSGALNVGSQPAGRAAREPQTEDEAAARIVAAYRAAKGAR